MLTIDDYLKAAHFGAVWINQDFVIRASSALRCIRSQMLNGFGFRGSRTVQTLCLMEMGTCVHEVLQRTILGLWPKAEFEVQYTRRVGKATVRATIDIVNEDCGYEIKTYGYKNNHLLENNPPWRGQVELGHRLSGLQMHVYATPRAFPLNQSSLQYVEPDDNIWSMIQNDIISINLHLSNQTLPDRPVDKSECAKCDYGQICGMIDIGNLDVYKPIPQQIIGSEITIVESEKDKYNATIGKAFS